MRWGSRQIEPRDLAKVKRLVGRPARLWFLAPGGSARFDERTGRTLPPLVAVGPDRRDDEQDH